MTIKFRGKTDEYIEAVLQCLRKYEQQHPQAEIEAYRQNSVSIRIRIVDPAFSDISLAERHDTIWKILDELPEEILSHLTVILLLTPDEQPVSFANMEFDDPIPSSL